MAGKRTALLALLTLVAVSVHAAGKPNIIFLLTDDQRDNSFGIMGHEFVKTPNVDKLIQNGVRFSNAYIAEPTCAPSRVSFFTGMHERVNGVGFSSSYKLNEKQWEQTYPAVLKRNGYYTGFIGKFGVEYYTFRGQADKRFDFWRGHDGWANFFPKTKENCKSYHDSGEDIITPVMGESITQFLNQAPADKPFCLSVSFSVPHGSQMFSMHDWEKRACENPKLKGHPVYGYLYRDLGVGIPADTATDPYRYIPKALLDQEQGRKDKIYPYDYTVEACREHHIRYYQQITGLDLVIGDMVETLKAKGLDKNTVIIFASDHGLLMGEYGMGGKALLYDLTAKFPCFVYDPYMPDGKRGRNSKALISSLDITSTILDYAGVDQPSEMTGKSLRPLIVDAHAPWRDFIFLENLYTGRDTPFSEGIRKGKWKYIRMYDGVEPYTEKDTDFRGRTPDFEQLFDLETDPGEMENLIATYEGSDLLSDLRAMCQSGSDDLNNQRTEYKKSHTVTPRHRPSILFISVDDLRPELGCYGQDYMITPNIDRLANEGVLFENAYCNYPVCGASRASLMSGLRPTPKRFTSYKCRADVDAAGIPDLAATLKAAGYRTINNGKIYHHHDDNAASWDEIFRPKEFCLYFNEENLKLVTGEEQYGSTPKGWPYEAADEPDESYQGAKVAAKAIAELKRAKETGKPVFITAGFTKPHLPFNCPEKYWDLYPADTITMPDNFFVPTNAPAEAIHDFNELRSYHNVPETGPLPEEMALNLIRGYRACTTFSDAMIGRIFQTLEELEMWDDTIVILWGDHGWQLGEHTLWCKHANFNTSLQVPLIIRVPGKSTQNTASLVEFVDLYPTICDLAGIEKPAHLEGTSFVPLLDKPSTDWKKAVFGRYQKGDSIRTARYLYTEWRNERGEMVSNMLYDHNVDPAENNNIADHPEYKHVVKKLAQELKAGWPHLQK